MNPCLSRLQVRLLLVVAAGARSFLRFSEGKRWPSWDSRRWSSKLGVESAGSLRTGRGSELCRARVRWALAVLFSLWPRKGTLISTGWAPLAWARTRTDLPRMPWLEGHPKRREHGHRAGSSSSRWGRWRRPCRLWPRRLELREGWWAHRCRSRPYFFFFQISMSPLEQPKPVINEAISWSTSVNSPFAWYPPSRAWAAGAWASVCTPWVNWAYLALDWLVDFLDVALVWDPTKTPSPLRSKPLIILITIIFNF